MKKITLFIVLIIFGFEVYPQDALWYPYEYLPAPGQHINIENLGTPQAVKKMTENFSSLVSLGSFGGYLIIRFENACINHPDNPYGVDFTLFGNAFAGSAEPGIVWVMQDNNKNGIPDDTWYEISGSHHFFSGIERNYTVSYYKTDVRDILWKDNLGQTGRIPANEFNLQEYYPRLEYFPSYPQDSIAFHGTLLENTFVKSNSEDIKLAAPQFGYADCHPHVQGVELSLPDNPYTPEIEGAGGDPIDISWATDSLGNYVDLDSIHFIKIVSASLNNAGWLGEISTDISWVQSVLPKPEISGKENILVVKPHVNKILVGDSLQLEAVYFSRGRNTNSSVSVQSLNGSIAAMNSSGFLVAVSEGDTQIRFTANEEVQVNSVKVVAPANIHWLSDFSAVYPGDTLELIAKVYDKEQEVLDLLPTFSVSNPSTGKILFIDDIPYFIAIQPGEPELTASLERFDIREQVTVKIHSPGDKIKILLSVKTSHENLIPLQWIETGLADLNSFVENRQQDYSNLERITLFHALAAGLQLGKIPFNFRDDEAAGGKLYLYKVENDGLFSYGWGGKTYPAANARAWIARINNSQHLNDFDNILLSDGDTLLLYHVPDLLNMWDFTRLLSLDGSTGSTDDIRVLLEKTTCTLENGKISESGFLPVVNAAVSAGKKYYTNEQGIAVIESGNEFPLFIAAGNDAIFIAEKLTTTVSIPTHSFRVFPNPVTDFLFIDINLYGKSQGNKSGLKLYNTDGSIILEKTVVFFPVNLNLSSLPPGIYYLVIENNRKSGIKKIIKQ